MDINISIGINSSIVSRVAEEAECNESVFVREFCSDVLQQVARQTKEIGETAREINLVNPYGFPTI